MSGSPPLITVPAQSGIAVELRRGQRLTVVDLYGSQVADVVTYARDDVREHFSPGRTIDYAESIALTVGNTLYSNRSNPMLVIVTDDVGRHDCLLSPCSERMFELLRSEYGHRSCHENLWRALAPFGIGADDVTGTFNAFMNVRVAEDGRVTIEAPLSRAGEGITFEAQMDLIAGITACSSERTNGGDCGPVGYAVVSPPPPPAGPPPHQVA